MGVDFMNEFVEVMFVPLAEVDEGLHCLVRVCGNILLAAFVDNLIFVSLDLMKKGANVLLSCRR